MNYFQAQPNKPYHLSVGAIVLNDKNEVLCEHYLKLNEMSDVYWLMHSTVKPNETLEESLIRGLKEEMGLIVNIETFLGVLNYESTWFGEIDKATKVTKSIAYFIVKEISRDPLLKDAQNSGSKSEIVTISLDDLIQKMRSQESRINHGELDESMVLERVKEYLSSQEVLA